jgi:malate dehydrogenase (oxaloacetate-decarboxylating)
MDSIKISEGGKLEAKSKLKVTKDNISKIYTPGVAEVVKLGMKSEKNVDKYTWRGNLVAVISDGSAILGLGNQGPGPALPVMEAKSVLFKELGGVDAIPIVLNTQDMETIISTIKNIAPSFGGINLEDISAPRCFEIEERLQKELDIPVFHDDQHGAAIAILAGLINAAKVAGKNLKKDLVVVSGAGAAGVATIKLLHAYGCRNLALFDSRGGICKTCANPTKAKEEIAKMNNLNNPSKTLREALKGADVFIGLSVGNLLTTEDIKTMNDTAIVFALANPVPEILPEDAEKGGAYIIGTGRSDFPNQINNALVFPGIFKGLLTKGKNVVKIEDEIRVAKTIANLVKKPTRTKLLPTVTNKKVAVAVAKAV